MVTDVGMHSVTTLVEIQSTSEMREPLGRTTISEIFPQLGLYCRVARWKLNSISKTKVKNVSGLMRQKLDTAHQLVIPSIW